MKKEKKIKEPKNCRLGKVGGEAVLEGVMMKSGDDYAVTVRKEDGSLEIIRDKHVSIRKKFKFLNIPVLRGVVNMVETFMLSYKALSISADAYGIDETEEETKFEKWLRSKFGAKLMDVVMVIAMVLGMALGFGLFMFLPITITKLIESAVGSLGWVKNLIEGLIKMTVFVAYIAAVSAMKDIRRTFEYHGAEHKSIFCYESGEELTVENVKKFSRFHPRCGTSFLFVMLILSILIYSLPFVTWENALVRMLTKIALLPVIIGVGYEFLMFSGKHPNPVTRILSAPGMMMQRLTTREPDDSQIEVAITSLKAAMPGEFPAEAPAEEPAVDEENG